MHVPYLFNTTHSDTLTCLCTFVSCSKLFSRKEIFCFWVENPPLPSSSISELCKKKHQTERCLEFSQGFHGAVNMRYFTFHCTHSFNSSCKVLDKKLPQVVQALEFTSLGSEVDGARVMVTIIA